MHRKSILGISMICLLVIVGLAIGGAWLNQSHHDLLGTPAISASEPERQDEVSDQLKVSVKTVLPRCDPSFTMSVDEPAYVVAYYQADLLARVAGPTKSISVDIGDRVQSDQALVVVDVPDLQEAVQQKEAIVQQRRKDLELAKANVKIATAAIHAAEGTVKIKVSGVDSADATRNFREKQLHRFTDLSSGEHPSVTLQVIDERTLFYESAKAASEEARAEVIKANADLEEAKAKLEAAVADVNLKESLVRVAGKDKDLAQTLLDYATIRAPFDGVITRRNVDPGSFVQNATTGHSDPLLTVGATDLVTVYMKVPDYFANFVAPDTEAVITMKTLPAMKIHAKLTRFSPSLLNPERDLTMRVEVDLYNGNPADFAAFVAKEKAEGYAGLKGHLLPRLPSLERHGGAEEPVTEPLNLLPGMYGNMRLVLRNFKNALLLPSSALVSEGGRSFIYQVKDGRAVKVPVEKQADDGNRVLLTLIENSGAGLNRRQLCATDEVVISNQGELSDGQPVRPIRE